MDVTLIFNGVDFAPCLASYRVAYEVEYSRQVTALDGTEYTTKGTRRPIAAFALKPLSDENISLYYGALSALTALCVFTDPASNTPQAMRMRVTTDLETVFCLRSADGKRYYEGKEIELRAVTPLA